jgi:hypothetical protein
VMESERMTAHLRATMREDEMVAEMDKILKEARARKFRSDIAFDAEWKVVGEAWFLPEELDRFHALKLASGRPSLADEAKQRIKDRRKL